MHLSAREVLDVLTRFKGDGGRLYGETCPQYLDLTNQAMLDHGALAKIGPPLREAADTEAMWRGIAERLIDTVGSNFCGYNKSQKYSGGQSVGAIVDRPDLDEGGASIFDASFGGNWAEQMLPVVYEEGVNKGRITLPRLVQVMCENPRRSSACTRKRAYCSPAPMPTSSCSTPRSDIPSARRASTACRTSRCSRGRGPRQAGFLDAERRDCHRGRRAETGAGQGEIPAR